MRVQTEIKCPGCEVTNLATFKKPSPLENSIFTFKCKNPECESSVLVKARKPRASDNLQPQQLLINASVTKPGPKLSLRLLAEAEERIRKEQNGDQKSQTQSET